MAYLGVLFSELGRPTEALPVTREATTISGHGCEPDRPHLQIMPTSAARSVLAAHASRRGSP
jgi:hypothetical protein